MRKLAFSVAVILALLAWLSHSKRTWVVFAQGPVTYTFDTYATYQFNTFKHPTGLVASSGYLFIADTDNNLIRQFYNGNLSVVAGNGQAGYVDGPVTSAEFNDPTGLQGGTFVWTELSTTCDANCPDPSCPRSCYPVIDHPYTQLYVSDSENYVVRMVCSGDPPVGGACNSSITDTVTTVAGNHAQGYVDGAADPANNLIRSWDGSNVGTFAGTGTHGLVNGYRTSAQFGAPTKMAWDGNGNMYVTDADNFVIRKIDTAGNVITFAGSGSPGFTDGQGSGAQFTYPGDILFNPADGYFYITDSGNNAIRRMDVYGNVTTYAGAKQGGFVNGALLQARFQSPTGLAIYTGYLYVADTMNNAIRRIDMNAGQVSTYIN